MTNGFLVSVPHEGLHGAISILEQRPETADEYVQSVWAVKDVDTTHACPNGSRPSSFRLDGEKSLTSEQAARWEARDSLQWSLLA